MKQLRVFKAFVLVFFALLSAAAPAAATTIEELVASAEGQTNVGRQPARIPT